MSGAEITVFAVIGACLLLIVYSRWAGSRIDDFVNMLLEKKRSRKSTNQNNT